MKRPVRPFWILFLLFALCALPLLAAPEAVRPQTEAPVSHKHKAPAPHGIPAALSRDLKRPPAPPNVPQPKSLKPAKPQQVYVGVYLNNVVALDLIQNTYWMDFYIWFRWKGDINPTQTFELMNAYEKWGATAVEESEEPRILKDGWKYQELHIEQELHSPFQFNSYPLDQQALNLKVEDKSHTSSVLTYLPDTTSTGYSPEIFIPGWKVDRHLIEVKEHTYKTNFGQLGKPNETYSRLKFSIEMTRSPRMMYLFKLFLPIVIILVMVFVIFFIPISFFDSRVEIAITGLLSMIALQMVLNDTLPPVGYLTLTDKVYYFSYFVVMCALIETVWVYFSFKKDEYLARRIDLISTWFMLTIIPIAFALFFTVFRG